MKKFFRDYCVFNADGVSAFILISFYLFFIWQLISSGFLVAQLFAVILVFCFLCSTLIGFVILLVDLIRKIFAKVKNNSAPTEVSAE